jgi:hypothetical protein
MSCRHRRKPLSRRRNLRHWRRHTTWAPSR